jgi:hypothetical protein
MGHLHGASDRALPLAGPQGEGSQPCFELSCLEVGQVLGKTRNGQEWRLPTAISAEIHLVLNQKMAGPEKRIFDFLQLSFLLSLHHSQSPPVLIFIRKQMNKQT